MATLYVTPEQYQHLSEINLREGLDGYGTSIRKYRSFLSAMVLEGRAIGIDPRTVFDTKPDIEIIVGDPPRAALTPKD